ncbi:MAG: hypothetical protein IJ381_01810 [Clostridia bacterium]|nr:hypothetical protein [Clostridia bacterium]
MRSIRKISGVNMDYEPGGNAAQRAKGYAKRVSNNKVRTEGHALERAAMIYEC